MTYHTRPTDQQVDRLKTEINHELKSLELKHILKEQECLSLLRRMTVLRLKRILIQNTTHQEVFGPGERQVIMAGACSVMDMLLKNNYDVNQQDICDVLWCKYRFYLKKEGGKEISQRTLESDFKKARSLFALPEDPLSKSRRHIDKAIREAKRPKNMFLKIWLSPALPLLLQEIGFTMVCICI